MRYEIEVEGELRRVTVRRVGDGFAIELDGRSWHVDAVRIDPHTLSLLVRTLPSSGDTSGTIAMPGGTSAGMVATPGPGGFSHDVTVTSDGRGQSMARVGSTSLTVTLNGRHRKAEDGGHAQDGPQRIVAPLPGKIVRVLVAAGDAVHARQPLVVVEAMKMENELRADRDGIVSVVHVKEGASVDAGAPLIDIL